MVVNNGAAAVLLVLAALARGRGVAVSRGELVEIGGGFRVPEVMAESGARLVEVGTTNRTRPTDFARAVADTGADVALVMKVHQSNYRITGFTEQADVAELAGLGVPVVADIGSGLLDAACGWLPSRPDWLGDEPAARQTLEAGADVVVFSGDKLFGGPQAGLIAGRPDLGRRLRPPPAGPRPAAREPGARRRAGHRAGLSPPGRRTTSPSGGWPPSPLDELRFRAQRIVTLTANPALSIRPGRLRARRRHPARGGDPVGGPRPRRRPHHRTAPGRPPDHRPGPRRPDPPRPPHRRPRRRRPPDHCARGPSQRCAGASRSRHHQTTPTSAKPAPPKAVPASVDRSWRPPGTSTTGSPRWCER